VHSPHSFVCTISVWHSSSARWSPKYDYWTWSDFFRIAFKYSHCKCKGGWETNVWPEPLHRLLHLWSNSAIMLGYNPLCTHLMRCTWSLQNRWQTISHTFLTAIVIITPRDICLHRQKRKQYLICKDAWLNTTKHNSYYFARVERMTWNDDVLVGSVIFKNLRILFFWRKMSKFFEKSYLQKYKDSKNGNLSNEIVSSRPFQRPSIYSYLLLPSVDNPHPMKNLLTFLDALVTWSPIGISARVNSVYPTSVGVLQKRRGIFR